MTEGDFESCSAEATLAVPLDVVFRVCSGVGQSRSKDGGQNLLFTRSEITTLLKVEMVRGRGTMPAVSDLTYSLCWQCLSRPTIGASPHRSSRTNSTAFYR